MFFPERTAPRRTSGRAPGPYLRFTECNCTESIRYQTEVAEFSFVLPDGVPDLVRAGVRIEERIAKRPAGVADVVLFIGKEFAFAAR